MTRSALVLSLSQLLLASAATAQQTGTVSGQVVDRESLKPVPAAVVRIRGTELRALTDTLGIFRIAAIPVGRNVVEVEHIAYGAHADSVVLSANGEVRIQIRISGQAIQLTPLLVGAMTELERGRRTSGHSFNEIRREAIDEASKRGIDLAQLLRDGMLGIRVSAASRAGSTYCVEYRGSGGPRASCREVTVFIDGVRISAPSTLYSTMPIDQIERLQLLSPAEAGARYGSAGGWGVLLIETRQGTRLQRLPNAERLVTGFDWSLEPKPYRWPSVVGGAVLGNAVGLGLGQLVADQCLRVSDGIKGLRSSCGAAATVGSGFLVVVLPSVAATFATQWGGSSERSQGRIMPSLLLGSLTIAGGYLLFVQGDANNSAGTRTAGVVLLTVGTPMVTIFADRVFRHLR